jgi:hypothetical protein
MSQDKKTRPMTPKRFATRTLSAKVSVEGFLAAHRQFLDGYSFLSPILQAYDSKQLLPSPTLATIQSALLSHYMLMERNKALAKMAARQEEEAAPTKNYTVSLYVKTFDKEGNMSVEVGQIHTRKWVEKENPTTGKVYLEPYTVSKAATWEAATYGEAERLADRKLFSREDSLYATIQNNYDTPITTYVQRSDAVYRTLRQAKAPVSRVRGLSTRSLNFTPHSNPTRNVWHLKKG